MLPTERSCRCHLCEPKYAEDLEKSCGQSLSRSFDEYLTLGASGRSPKHLMVYHLEVECGGFKKAWQERDYGTIIAVAEKIPDNVLQEDPRLLLWYDQALTRSGEEG